MVVATFVLVILGMGFLWIDSEPDTSRVLHALEQNFIDIDNVQNEFVKKKWFMQGNLEEIACAPTNEQLTHIQVQGPICWYRTKNNGFLPEEAKLVTLPISLQRLVQDGFMLHANADDKTWLSGLSCGNLQ